jgi:hypothetical protein
VFFSAPDPAKPKILSSEAQALLDKVNWRLKSPFMHGAQDDYFSPKNPNVQRKTEDGKFVDRFMVFNLGHASYVCNASELRLIYERILGASAWPYDERGVHRITGA